LTCSDGNKEEHQMTHTESTDPRPITAKSLSTGLLLKEVLAGAGLSFSQVARKVPPGRGDRPTSPATIWRWAKAGIKLADGRCVRLECLRVGGRHVTSEGALQRFITALQGGAGPPAPQTDNAADAERTARKLDAILGPVD
jgi:hypothetical protein